MTSKVYILQDNPNSAKNYISAEKFGELIVCFSGHISNVSLPKYISKVREKLRNIKRVDWLIAIGHPAIIAFAGHVMIEKTGVLNILIWDRQSETYLPLKVEENGSSTKNS